MAFRAIWSLGIADQLRSVAGVVVAIALILAIPAFTLLAFRAWAKRIRKELPRWRNVLCVISISSMFLSWLIFVSHFFFIALGIRAFTDADIWLGAAVLMLVIGIPLAFALKSSSRARTLLAGLLMILLLWASINV